MDHFIGLTNTVRILYSEIGNQTKPWVQINWGQLPSEIVITQIICVFILKSNLLNIIARAKEQTRLKYEANRT